MKKIFVLLALVSLSSCSTNEDEINFEELNNSTNSLTNRAPIPGSSMTINCTNIPTLVYTGVINWNLGLTIPYPDANAYIQIQPTSLSSTYPIVNIPITYISSGSKNIIHSGIGSVGDITLAGNNIYIYAKTFNYRYIIFDNDSSDFVATNWYSHNLIQYCPNCRLDQIIEP
ncbi:MAG: hypothetical protein ACH34V_01445 [Flavobacterium sp.]|uniref:hypothetical protein n=1 Tax=Flavobacterium sp. TaxID=239 RepID=UPI0037BCFF10